MVILVLFQKPEDGTICEMPQSAPVVARWCHCGQLNIVDDKVCMFCKCPVDQVKTSCV